MRVSDHLYIVADDELHLACLDARDPGTSAIQLVRVSQGALPDAASRPQGGFIFTAVAEDTNDAYNDGACVGSVVGWADEEGRVRACEPLQGAPKVEGIAFAGGNRLWLVTDADDPARPSQLLELEWTG